MAKEKISWPFSRQILREGQRSRSVTAEMTTELMRVMGISGQQTPEEVKRIRDSVVMILRYPTGESHERSPSIFPFFFLLFAVGPLIQRIIFRRDNGAWRNRAGLGGGSLPKSMK